MDKKKEMAIDFLETIKGQINHNDVLKAFIQGYDEGFLKGSDIGNFEVVRFLGLRIIGIDLLRKELPSISSDSSGNLESLVEDLLNKRSETEDLIEYFREKAGDVAILMAKINEELYKLASSKSDLAPKRWEEK